MNPVTNQSLREECARLKSDYSMLCEGKKVTPESEVILNGLTGTNVINIPNS